MTTHTIITGNSSNMTDIQSGSINLIVTSPPYPMIEMWDKMFAQQNPAIGIDLQNNDGMSAFYKMHELLKGVWKECNRVLADNGFVCINIGDATRTINDSFQLYPNHTQIINCFLQMGYSVLPDIHWRKQSNAPNKFMGSGMYPAGAYVTYEHEYILIFRKGGKRVFKGTERSLRQNSAFFWEERNIWFSDLWELKGISQTMAAPKTSRGRSAAYPFEIPYRLINMYSAKEDTVLDPFNGLGTTILACMASKRNSYGVEIDAEIAKLSIEYLKRNSSSLADVVNDRINKHLLFIDSLSVEKKKKCYKNNPHGFLVKTKQETAIRFDVVKSVSFNGMSITCSYE